MSSLRGARVLIVEDEAMLSLNLAAILRDLGCVVAGTADKLDDALRLARTSDFDVALLDVGKSCQLDRCPFDQSGAPRTRADGNHRYTRDRALIGRCLCLSDRCRIASRDPAAAPRLTIHWVYGPMNRLSSAPERGT
jgi:DNA-binding NarL/FixJ family response regulator